MSTFPDQPYDAIGPFADAYFERLATAAASVDRTALAKAANILTTAYAGGHQAFACGNGGSAAISNHLVCDHAKSGQTDTDLRPKVHSLSSNIEMITALANDISYDAVFSYQLATYAEPEDVLVTISSSGDSENVVQAITWAKANGVAVIAMTGFDGGRSKEMADVSLHVVGDNYGIIEDTHQSLMHILAQYIRQSRVAPALVADIRF